jgi:hypothetical protein
MNGPRNIAGPVVRGTNLWGRDSDIAQLWKLLENGSVLLTGPRRHGKSSLMYALLDTPPKDFHVILLDIEWVETPEEFLTTMAAELLANDRIRQVMKNLKSMPTLLKKWVGSAIDEVGVGVGSVGELKIRLRSQLSDGNEWNALAEQMLGTLRELPGRTVLILDEFPIMISNMLEKNTETALRFLRWFRTFRQSPGTERLTFLLGGSTNIEPRLESLGTEVVLGDLQRHRIMPFDEEHARQFVRELLNQERVDRDSDVDKEILDVCQSGVPYYLQVIVAECLAEARRKGRTLLRSDIRPIYEELVIGPVNRHRFSHYHTRLRLHYGELEGPARVVLACLCPGSKSMKELGDALVTAGFSRDVLDRLIVLLEGDYYIFRERDSARFSDGLLRDWWSRNSVPPKVRA